MSDAKIGELFPSEEKPKKISGAKKQKQYIAGYAVAQGHEVTCLARGSAPAATGARLVVGDRDRDDTFEALAD